MGQEVADPEILDVVFAPLRPGLMPTRRCPKSAPAASRCVAGGARWLGVLEAREAMDYVVRTLQSV